MAVDLAASSFCIQGNWTAGGLGVEAMSLLGLGDPLGFVELIGMNPEERGFGGAENSRSTPSSIPGSGSNWGPRFEMGVLEGSISGSAESFKISGEP